VKVTGDKALSWSCSCR